MNERETYVRAWHAEVCALARKHEREADEQPCAHCGRPKKEHDHSHRCSAWVCTTHYSPKNGKEVEQTAGLILALEALAVAAGWKV
jgi:hypothetical protein